MYGCGFRVASVGFRNSDLGLRGQSDASRLKGIRLCVRVGVFRVVGLLCSRSSNPANDQIQFSGAASRDG